MERVDGNEQVNIEEEDQKQDIPSSLTSSVPAGRAGLERQKDEISLVANLLCPETHSLNKIPDCWITVVMSVIGYSAIIQFCHVERFSRNHQ